MEKVFALQVVNAILLLAVLPFSVSVLLSILSNKVNRDNGVRDILVLVFVSITIASILSLLLYLLQFIGYKDINNISILSNIRNLIKNFAFFITSFCFWMIERKRNR